MKHRTDVIRINWRNTRVGMFTLLTIGLLIVGLLPPRNGSFTFQPHMVQAAETFQFTENFNNFGGTGFVPSPTTGQLDSDTWRVTGMTDGDGTFGGSHTTGDFARDTSTGGITTGGVYAFQVGNGDTILGVQPTTDDFTPGTITLKLTNTTSKTINALNVAYEVWYNNDQGRANSLNVSYSTDDSSYTALSDLNVTTPEASDTSGFQSVLKSATIIGLNIASGSSFFLQWSSDDESGSGSRDEFGINNVSVNLVVPPIYVNATASGNNNGTSWVNAYTNLQDALAAATNGDEIWVATGVYTPTDTLDSTVAFTLTNGVALYGGFDGSETNRDVRDWTANPTVLSGDIDQNDTTTAGISGTNSLKVVVGADNATLDGFIITGGDGNMGGGMQNYQCSPTIANVTFTGNRANSGGGMYNSSGNPILTNVIFSGNSADSGGGMYNNDSSPSLTNVTFSGNSADSGGGIYNARSNVTLTNAIISGNTATAGGGIQSTGGSMSVTNATISGNDADSGGGIYNESNHIQTINNTIVWGNSDTKGNNIIRDNSIITFTYSIIQQSGGSNAWNPSVGIDGGNNHDIPPLFVSPRAADTAPTTSGDYRLQPSSIAVDAGNKDLLATGVITTDCAGAPRVVGTTIDIGAYETQDTTDTYPPRITIEPLISRVVTPTIRGTIDDPTATIQITVTTTPYTATNNGDGTWQGTISNPINEGDYTVTAVATDSSANHTTATASLIVNKQAGQPWYVRADGSENDTCLDWTNACDLQTALHRAISGDDIWIATGIYTPGITPEATFLLPDGVALYGGFPSNGSGTMDTRDWHTYQTVLSGDIDGDDTIYNPTGIVTHTFNMKGNNSYHVITSHNVTSGTLDGIVVTAGEGGAYSTTDYHDGGGLHSINSTLTIRNTTFYGNDASYGNGGGVYNKGGDITLTNVAFIANNGGEYGGGIHNDGGTITLLQCVFNSNTAGANNFYASTFGGGISSCDGDVTITHGTFVKNNSDSGGGGGIYNNGSHITITNSIVWQNDAQSGSNIYNADGSNLVKVSYSLVEGNYAGVGNSDADPLFVDTPKMTTEFYEGNLRLQGCSPAIDTAHAISDTIATDLDGNSRQVGVTVDIGAYEYQATQARGTLSFTDTAASGVEGTGSPTSTTTIGTIERVGGNDCAVSVDILYDGGTAIDGVDFTHPFTRTVLFGDGESTKPVTVTLVDDTIVEADETIAVRLTNPQSVALGAITRLVYTIVDNDVAPTPKLSVTTTPEPSVTTTPTVTVTPEPSVTVTPEPSVTTTPTVTVTPEPSVTTTPEPSVTVTPTVTVTPEPSVTTTPTVTVTPEPSVTTTPTPQPTRETHATVDGSSSGSIETSNGDGSLPVTINIPAGAVNETTTLSYTAATEPPTDLPTGFRFTGHVFTLQAQQGGAWQAGFVFAKPITITLTYDDTGMNDAAEQQLQLFYYDTTAGEWRGAAPHPAGYTYNTTANVVSIHVSHLTRFALVSEIAATNDDWFVYLPLIQR